MQILDYRAILFGGHQMLDAHSVKACGEGHLWYVCLSQFTRRHTCVLFSIHDILSVACLHVAVSFGLAGVFSNDQKYWKYKLKL